MIPVPGFEAKRVAMFGLGRTGLGVARALEAGGATVLCWDDGEARREEAQSEGLELHDLYNADWSQIEALVLSPGVPLTHPAPHALVLAAKAAEVPVIGDMELFQRALDASGKRARMVAVTGTNGKSTTTALIGHLIRQAGGNAQIGGNIGRAVLDLDPPEDQTVYVIEISSYQLDLAPGFRPDVAVLLNITPDHLDRHGNFENYVAIKDRIFANQTARGYAVFGIDSEPVARLCTSRCGQQAAAGSNEGGPKVIPISARKSLGRGVYVLGGKIYHSRSSRVEEGADLNGITTLQGSHNWENAAAAFAAVRVLGIDPAKIADGLKRFPGLAHRMEQVGEHDGVRFINDSKATNADAAARALATYDKIYWIAGGVAKAGGIEPLAEYFPKVAKAYLIGNSAQDFAATLDGRVKHTLSGTLDEAVLQAAHDAAKDENAVVLLSPACASFDQFPDFEKRGDAFRDAVRALAQSSDKAKQGGGAAA
ncbi:UDP-N-acetylmuramoylalanine--D-glutamate ligase [Candidatus Phaeomarinobacter ectocarpi]|uniref:UDP-N-acetylmuramoylalanine--D-glutamate ligase n=1 Tax=Candidatus Phaeomarinibacter ectocarpi TaxID=1458461 RepID=X5MLT1_9HYPH|nr:UDP-N-acetylmuramoyl-L-alanine--D-glutamate ligase [Candidatus Phaeomarinobacter ectocarpi]CDO58681.1 UDP-N-acetylmuramoylalanine--D-glutamate ligase [Candidatus Phaeomarinobacter ectocarpi]